MSDQSLKPTRLITDQDSTLPPSEGTVPVQKPLTSAQKKQAMAYARFMKGPDNIYIHTMTEWPFDKDVVKTRGNLVVCSHEFLPEQLAYLKETYPRAKVHVNTLTRQLRRQAILLLED